MSIESTESTGEPTGGEAPDQGVQAVVALLQERRAVLTGSEGIPTREMQVGRMRTALAAAEADLNACRAEVEQIEFALRLLEGSAQ